MKSSLRSDEIQGCPWMKSNPQSCNAGLHRESDFIHASGFNPSRTDLIMQATACIIRPLDTNNRRLHFAEASTHNLPPSDEGGVTKWRRERVAKCSYISCKQEVILPSAVILASPVILLTMFAVKDEIALRWNLHYVQMKSLRDEILLRRVMLVGRWACSRRKKPPSDGGNTWGRGTYSRHVRTRFECTKQKNHQKT